MDIVKIPKKLRDIFDVIRSGDIEKGVGLLESVKGFEPQKSIALAEIAYFSSQPDAAMSYDEKALPFNEQWYAGNVLSEHLSAYTRTAVKTNQIDRAVAFYNHFLEEKKDSGLPEHQIKMYNNEIGQHIRKLNGDKNLPMDGEVYKIITNGLPMDDFTAQLKQYRPKLTFDSAAGADYLLHAMYTKANTNDFLDYYEKYADDIRNDDHHLNAAKVFVLTNQPEQAKKAVMRFVMNVWWPVEYIQVMPMQLWEISELDEILTPEFCKEILFSAKCIR